ncbi:hypothetical protein [Sphingomonas sanguinis]|uniref:hypothetical protein n=1 Tax=Sphingomonas sanguinis TaxID=33051 RepID=UPI000ABE8B91|nr:hypothetical protein [Sphingomonas sanguinis]
MIVVRVELWSAVTGNVTEIARMTIDNIGGTEQSGDYRVRTMRGRSAEALHKAMLANTLSREAQVLSHPRLRDHVWSLVAKALIAMRYGSYGTRIVSAHNATLSADAIRQGEGVSIPADLREAARYASDGPWEIDSERNEDGAYGGGPDHGTGYDDYLILDAQGRALFGSENSTAKLIEEEYSEDGVYAWDQVGKRNAAFIVAAVNFVRAMITTPSSHASDGGKA